VPNLPSILILQSSPLDNQLLIKLLQGSAAKRQPKSTFVHFKPENASRSKRLQEPTLKPTDLVDQALDPMHHYCLAATTV